MNDRPAERNGPTGGGRKDRTRGRDLALRYLYAADLSGLGHVESFDDFAQHQEERGVAVAFARELVVLVIGHLDEIDAFLVRFARNWKLERMAVVDRNVLRLGCTELLKDPKTPVAVIIDEAVELAKRYGSEKSGGFVNGMLDRIAHTKEVEQVRGPALPRRDES